MEPIKINVQVNFAADKSLVDLVAAVAGKILPPAQPAAAPETKPAVEETKPAAVETKPAKPARKAPKAESKAPAEETKPEVEETAAQAEEPAPAPEKEFTEVDVRAAMDRTRKRIEGEDYKEKTDSDGYKQWHRVLTAWFKKTAATYGSEKPSTLQTSEKRQAFIKECDALMVKDGELIQNLPF